MFARDAINPGSSQPTIPRIRTRAVFTQRSGADLLLHLPVRSHTSEPHGPPGPLHAWSTSAGDRATLAQYIPLARLNDSYVSANGDLIEKLTFPSRYLHSGDFWLTDSGASCYMTQNSANVYGLEPPPPGRKLITIGDRRMVRIEYVGDIGVLVYGYTDERITLVDVSYIPGLAFNTYSIQAVQLTT